mgnify:FL=1
MKTNKYFSPFVLVLAATFFAYDIVTDLVSGGDSVPHIIAELTVFLAITMVLFQEIKRVIALRSDIHVERLKTARLSGELFKVMNDQFAGWGLSKSETEVALLLIKGMSMKEISELRQVKEKTVRQQATQIYAKSGYAGRHELAAHFIEDLLQVEE